MPAPTFADRYEALPLPRILHAYEAAPARFATALADLSADDLRARPRPGKWSIGEVLAHVADAEVVTTARVRMVLAAPGVRLVAYDQDAYARRFEYGNLTAGQLQDQLALFGALRRTLAPVLAGLRPQDWAVAGLHEERGRLTVRNIVDLAADHGERHLGQVLAMRGLLGKPRALEPLLPERLY
jgi:uncharacterized damage-inducible protein DinB